MWNVICYYYINIVMNKKLVKYFYAITMVFFSVNAVFAISPKARVLYIGQNSEVGAGIFPVSSGINFDVYSLPINEKYPIDFDLKIFGGYGESKLKQNPTDGLASWCESYTADELTFKKYGKIFSGSEFIFSQTLPISDSIPGTLSFWTSYSTLFERPVDLVNYWSVSGGTKESIFLDSAGNYLSLWNNPSLLGAPDLQGNKALFSNSLNFGLTYKYNIFELPYEVSLKSYYAPYWFMNKGISSYDGSTDYFKLKANLNIYKSFFEYKYKDSFSSKDLRLVELILSNTINYRYLNGMAVPMSFQDFDNLRHDINYTLQLSVYGPQIINSENNIAFYMYYNADYKWGRLNNTLYEGTYPSNKRFSHSLNFNFNLTLINVLHLAWKNSFDLSNFNFSMGKPYFYVKL